MQSSWDDLLSLEDQFYKEGFDLGLADGEQAGRAEGRQFGMLTAFEKFQQLGVLHGRAEVLKSTLSPVSAAKGDDRQAEQKGASHERLRRHLDKLLDLTSIANVHPENTEEAVADVDERLKDAMSRATLVAKITGYDMAADGNRSKEPKNVDQLEDFQAKTRFNTDAT